jgi:hypothetical protein
MTDLQLGLLVIGAAAVVAVVAYNRLQERAVRRDAERSFGSAHPDVLADAVPARREPTLEPTLEPALEPAGKKPADPRMDYVIALSGVPLAELEQRFAGKAIVSGSQVALQMVSRRGVIGEGELLEFRAQVESLAAAHGASVSAPEMRAALEGAYALDHACAEVDIQIALHVIGIDPDQVLEAKPFKTARRDDGITLLLDVPRTADLAASYAAMLASARQLGGRLVDDNGNALDERALAAIGAELEAARGRLAELGIEPGSPLALRLFS